LLKTITQITNANLSFPIGQSKIKFFKDGNVNWQSPDIKRLVTEQRVKRIEEYSKKRLERLSKVRDQVENPGIDSDDDCYGYIFEVRDKVHVR